MKPYFQIRSTYLMITLASILVFAIGWGAVWFIKKASLATHRNALNHQEASKDLLGSELNNACKTVNGGNYLVSLGDQNFVVSPYANSSKVFRYIVLNSEALNNAPCMQGLISGVKKIDYSLSVAFSNRGKLVTHFYFEKEGN
jgi:hypothetical protein